MDLLQTIWALSTTPNNGLIGIIFNDWGIPFVFIEITVSVLLFTQLFNMHYSKKVLISYIILLSVFSGISNTFFNKPYCSYINMLIELILIMFIFKSGLLKGFLAEITPFFIIVVLETVFCKFFSLLLHLTYEELYIIPLIRIFIATLIYLSIYLSYRILKHYNLKITLIDRISKKNKFIFTLNSFFAIISISLQFYVVAFYVNIIPLFVSLTSIISLIIYLLISIFSLIKTIKLEETNQSLEKAQLYNQTLQLLHGNLSAFKHEFSNTMQSIEGYIISEDMNGLKEYYKSIKNECNNLNNLTALSPKLIPDAALYSLIASKYLLAEEAGITFNVNITINFNEIQTTPYKLTRILGVLLDNAIDAAKFSKEKEIFFEVTGPFKNTNCQKHIISIRNSYSNKDIDINRIYEYGFTSKKNNKDFHGIGLWEISKIIKKSKNLNLNTSKDKNFFKQDLEIFILNK